MRDEGLYVEDYYIIRRVFKPKTLISHPSSLIPHLPTLISHLPFLSHLQIFRKFLMESCPTRIPPKTTLMLLRTFLNRIIVIGFMVLVGFSLAKGIQSGSAMAIILSITSMVAGIYFLYLVAKTNRAES